MVAVTSVVAANAMNVVTVVARVVIADSAATVGSAKAGAVVRVAAKVAVEKDAVGKVAVGKVAAASVATANRNAAPVMHNAHRVPRTVKAARSNNRAATDVAKVVATDNAAAVVEATVSRVKDNKHVKVNHRAKINHPVKVNRSASRGPRSIVLPKHSVIWSTKSPMRIVNLT